MSERVTFIRVKRCRESQEDSAIVVKTELLQNKKTRLNEDFQNLNIEETNENRVVETSSPVSVCVNVFRKIGSVPVEELDPSKTETNVGNRLDSQLVSNLHRVKTFEERQSQFKKGSIQSGQLTQTLLLKKLQQRQQKVYRTIAEKRDQRSGVRVIDLEASDEKEGGLKDGYVWDVYVVDEETRNLISDSMEVQPDLIIYEYQNDFGLPEDDSDYDSEDSNCENHPYNSYPEEDDVYSDSDAHSGDFDRFRNEEFFLKHSRENDHSGDSDFDAYGNEEDYENYNNPEEDDYY